MNFVEIVNVENLMVFAIVVSMVVFIEVLHNKMPDGLLKRILGNLNLLKFLIKDTEISKQLEIIEAVVEELYAIDLKDGAKKEIIIMEASVRIFRLTGKEPDEDAVREMIEIIFDDLKKEGEKS